MSALLDLAARVEAAEGADRELDAAIFDAVNPRPAGWRHSGWPDPGNPSSVIYSAPAYTASLDAVMTLVPEGWSFEIVSGFADRPYANIWNPNGGDWDDSGDVYAATPALALAAAALRARAQ